MNMSRRSHNQFNARPRRSDTKRKHSDNLNDADMGHLTLQPTESESFEELPEHQSFNSESDQSEDSANRNFMPSGLLSPSEKTYAPSLRAQSKKISINEEDRLLMLAKHPNLTEEEVRIYLHEKSRSKSAKKMRGVNSEHDLVKSHQQHNVRFSGGCAVDADTGKSWDESHRKSYGGDAINRHSSAGAPEASFDQAWGDVENQDGTSNVQKNTPFSWKLWRKIFPTHVSTESSVSPYDTSLSVISDKTPKISNVDRRATRRRQNETNHPTDGGRWEQFRYKVLKTWKGRTILVLLLILLIALVSMIAVVSSTETDSSNQAAGARPLFPEFPTISPGQSKGTSTPTNNNEAFTTDTPTDILETRTPTESPTVVPQTMLPTSSQVDTEFPTQSPTGQPSTIPTELVTSVPSYSPTVLSSAAPTVDFLNTDPIVDVGVRLTGNEIDQRFGHAISLSRDGRILAVGAPMTSVAGEVQVGSVQIFEWVTNSWQPRGNLFGQVSGNQFGSDLSLSADGSILVVSEPTANGLAGFRSGKVRTFVYNGLDDYEELSQSVLEGAAASDHFGMSISLSAEGTRLVVGAPHHDNGGPRRNISGQVIVYELFRSLGLGGSWQPVATLSGIANLDWFGRKVDISNDGSIVCVGAPRNVEFGGYVRCYDVNNDQYLGEVIQNEIQPVRYDDNFGHSIKVVVSPTGVIQVAIGAPGKNRIALDSGIVSVHEHVPVSNQWKQIGGLVADASPQARDEFGFSLDFLDGVLVIGSPGRAKVDRYIQRRTSDKSTTWIAHPSSIVGDTASRFGHSVAKSDSLLAVGSDANSGSVNVFKEL